MELIAHSIQVAAIDEQGKETAATTTKEPLHRWTDPTREFSDGALWVRRASGRPVALVGIELYAQWSLEFVSLTPGRVKAEAGRVHWRPEKAGVEFRAIPDAPAPGGSEAMRLRQVRELAKRFSARDVWTSPNKDAGGMVRPSAPYFDILTPRRFSVRNAKSDSR